MDYVIPDVLAKALTRPSPRTQMESSLVGLLVMMLGSLGLVSYLIINGIISGFWYIALAITSELGIISFQWGLLAQTYQSYRQYKLMNNQYPVDYKLQLTLEEAERVKQELEKIINENKLDTTIKSNGGK